MKKNISQSRLFTIKHLFFLLFSAVMFLTLNSCSNGKLTDSKAEELLSPQYPKSRTSNVHLSDLSLSPGIPNDVKFLASKGLATYNYIPPGTQGYGCYGQLTDGGMKYLDRVISNEYMSMVVAKIGFDKVTGIVEIPQVNSAEVDYTEKIIEVTPVGEMYSDVVLGQTFPQKAVFVKYNDGWRLQPQQ